MEMEQNVPVAQRVHTRVRLPPTLHKRITERADTAGVPLGTYMAMLIQIAIEHWDTIPQPDRILRIVEGGTAPEVHQLSPQETELLERISPEPGTRHWHRIDNRKRENAVRTWFDQGREMGEFPCTCGKTVTREVHQ